MSNLPGAIKVLIIINAILFGIGLIPNVERPMFGLLAMWFPQNPNFQYWQVVTRMFLHGGWMHIILNMYAIWAFV
jgi:membrane associated rhomboid family serine protease